MINASNVGDVVFEILAKTVFKFLCFILVLALSNSVILEPDIQLSWGLHQNEAF